MGKKKVAGGRSQAANTTDEKVPFQLRLDGDLHGRLKEVADRSGISMNQLIQGICRGTLDHVGYGEAVVRPDGFVDVNDVKGCVYFGQAGVCMSDEQRQRIRNLGDEPAEERNGFVWFALDFTDRGVVRFQQTS